MVTNRVVTISDASASFIKALDKRTSFFVSGHEFHPAFRKKWWDGREHLIKKIKKKPQYKLPIGMLDRAVDLAVEQELELELEDARTLGSELIDVDWDDAIVPRDYQQAAVEAICLDRGMGTGKGMIRVPTRGGKTLIAARVIYELRRSTLFIVPSQMLLVQTVAAFERMLRVPIGIVGDGQWAPEAITVASIQTLAQHLKTDKLDEFMTSFDVAFFDECHHLRGKQWRGVFEVCDAMYKIGLSATIFLKDEDDNEISSIYLVACTGPVLYSIEPDELIRRGFLIRPRITCVTIRTPEVKGVSWQTAHRLGVITHSVRNRAIIALALSRRLAGRFILVVTDSLEHTSLLEQQLEQAGLVVGTIIGSTPAEARQDIIDRYNAGDIDVLLGTVFGEGVDIPKIEVVINAEGGKSQINTTQKFRNITPAPGKEVAEMIDFMDMHNKYLSGHSLGRLQVYKEHEEFRFKLVEVDEVL